VECLTKKEVVKVECWICRGTANSQEHFAKASDIRMCFGKPQNGPFYKHTDTTLNERVLSIKSNNLTFRNRICSKCNNQLTQPYDRAWEILSKYLRDHWPTIVENGYFDLSKVFPEDTRKKALHVHLYFVKRLGCQIIDEGNVRINLWDFSQALLLGTPHKNVFLTFSNAPETPIHNGEIIVCTRLRVEYSGDNPSFYADTAHCTYMPHPVTIRSSYLLRSAPRKYRLRTWHPSQRETRVRLGKYSMEGYEEYVYVPPGGTL
jgi:hypothetical protein